MYNYFNEKQDPKMIGLSAELMEKLDKAREIAKIPIIITSGLRSIEKNKKVGGVADSSHLNGLACDLDCIDSNTRFKIISGLIGAGIQRIGIADDHIHADVDHTKAQNVIFLE